MSVQDYSTLSKIKPIPVAGGIEERAADQDSTPQYGHKFSNNNGILPFYYFVRAIYQQQDPKGDGAAQRMFGKKIIDANPGEQIMSIYQVFNGLGQYGYYVQSNRALYFHSCPNPVDLHINYAPTADLGVDANNQTLDIFSQPPAGQPLPDDGISCVFGFANRPVPPNVAHAGIDYIIITVNPLDTHDVGLKTRLASLNSGSSYDNEDVGFYGVQNACRADSVPLVVGTDGSYEYPPTNAKYAYLAWGGNALAPIWASVPGPSLPNWAEISPPTQSHILVWPSNYVQGVYSISPGQSPQGWVAPTGASPGQRIYLLNSSGPGFNWAYVTGDRALSGTFTGYYILGASSGPNMSFPQGGFPPATNSQRYGILGQDIYQDIQEQDQSGPLWQRPYTLSAPSYTPNFTFATQTALFAFQDSNSGDIGKKAHVTIDNTYWQLTTIGHPVTVTWTYTDQTALYGATGFGPSDIGKIAHELDDNTYWKLTDFNRHANKSDRSETYLINLNRLFTDFQTITPATIQFMIRGYWFTSHTGSGQVAITATAFKGGTPVRTDSVDWNLSGGIQGQVKQFTGPCTLVVVNGDAKGNNIALITATMADGTLNITTPSPNSDGATLC